MQKERSQYSDSLMVGLIRGRNSSLASVKYILHVFQSRLGPTQPLVQWVPGALCPGVKRPRREADHSPPTSAKVKKTDLYIHSPIRLHGITLN
jgi:hypothetical protein